MWKQGKGQTRGGIEEEEGIVEYSTGMDVQSDGSLHGRKETLEEKMAKGKLEEEEEDESKGKNRRLGRKKGVGKWDGVGGMGRDGGS